MSAPIRTCVGCRVRAPLAELIRLEYAEAENAVVVSQRSRSGRGAYAHSDCLPRLGAPQLARALRISSTKGLVVVRCE